MSDYIPKPLLKVLLTNFCKVDTFRK
jgi:hypothetical protein